MDTFQAVSGLNHTHKVVMEVGEGTWGICPPPTLVIFALEGHTQYIILKLQLRRKHVFSLSI